MRSYFSIGCTVFLSVEMICEIIFVFVYNNIICILTVPYVNVIFLLNITEDANPMLMSQKRLQLVKKAIKGWLL